MATRKKEVARESSTPKPKRSYLSQSDVPGYALEQALRVPRALVDNFASGPASPLQVASALNYAPTSRSFRQLCGAAIAYGLTEGGYNAKEITLQPLGKRILKPLEDGDGPRARCEAVLKPRIVGEFLRKYNTSQLPRHDIALNVLGEMGVPSERAESVYTLILDSAESVGLLREIKNKQYVDLSGTPAVGPDERLAGGDEENQEELLDEDPEHDKTERPQPVSAPVQHVTSEASRRVFITHGKNKSFIDPIKKLLGFGELVPVVSVDKQSVSKPVPDKVMEDMRGCGAAIIHVDAEMTLIDKEAKERTVINPNVLIEIGAAMALYGRRFILLVRKGVDLPSNLQGLYEVRYEGDSLDGDATIRLLEAINDIKNHPLPDRYQCKE